MSLSSTTIEPAISSGVISSELGTHKARLWMPQRVVFTPAALDEPWGQQILTRVQSLNLPVEELRSNRLTGLRGKTERETYELSKRTLAVVTAPPSSLKLSPIPPSADWQFHIAEGSQLFDNIEAALDFDCDLTFELISHRFTPGSKEVLTQWYPHSKLDMNEETRTIKRNKFGGIKYVYERDTMTALRSFFERQIRARFPHAQMLYWT